MELPTFSVIVASRSRSSAERLAALLTGEQGLSVKVRVVANGHADPLHGVVEPPDLLLLHYSGQSELRFLADHGVRDQVALVVCGPVNNPESMRLAMRAGARDYLPEDLKTADLLASIARIRDESLRARTDGTGKLIVVVNGKGGTGASFIATNLAHSLVTDGGHRTTLVDLDLQFGGLCRYLDITPTVGLLEALEAVKDMDDISAEAYTCVHDSGLKLMAAVSKRLALPNEISVEQLDSLLNVYLSINDYIVADCPSRLDAVTELFLERADKIVVVVQQSLPHVQDAARLMQLLGSEIGIQKERIIVAVNRYAKNAEIEVSDIQKALRRNNLVTIPNQYKLATESINSGIPVADISKSAALTKGIRALQTTLAEPASRPDENILQRALPSFLRR